MWKFHPERPQDYPDDLMLYRNETPIQSIIDQSDLTKDITDESIRFIEENKDNQFFLYKHILNLMFHFLHQKILMVALEMVCLQMLFLKSIFQ